ncbi:MAG: hypothetical protein EA352_06950 [Gemmatimonadales bacterium]|nr:MAG: hypothetical protein EA352_06950 [Gemmatimonadales bacterium]
MRDPSTSRETDTTRASLLLEAIRAADPAWPAPLLRLRRLLREEGVGGRRAFQFMAELPGAASTPKAPLSVPREELALRLRVLRRSTEPPDEQDQDLLLLLHRSSDPILYPLAALTIGARLEESPALAARLSEDAPPPVLDGTRTLRRRLLLAAARPSPLPLPDLASSAPVPAGRRDLACLLLASADLVSRGLGPPLPRLLALLESAVVHLARGLDRVLALRVAEVLAAGEARGLPMDEPRREVLEALWPQPDPSRPDAADGRQGASTGSGLLRLRCTDEIARTRVEQGLGPPRQALPREADRFLETRVSIWQSIMDDPVDPGPAALPDGALRGRLLDAIRLLGEPRDWYGASESDRARALFQLLDTSLHGRTDPRIRDDLSRVGGLAPPGELDEAASVFRSRIVEQAATLESSLIRYLDPGLVHGLPTPLLVRTAGSHSARRQAAEFADALEHRVRMEVLDRGPQAARPFFLALAAARPGPALVQVLEEGLRDRPLLSGGDDPVPVEELLSGLARGTLSDLPPSAEEDPVPRALNRIREAGALVNRLDTDPAVPGRLGAFAMEVEHLREYTGQATATTARGLVSASRSLQDSWTELVPEVMGALPPADARTVEAEVEAGLTTLLERGRLLGLVASARDRDVALEALGTMDVVEEAPVALALAEWVGTGASSSNLPVPGRLAWAADAGGRLPEGPVRTRWMDGVARLWLQSVDHALEEGDPDRIRGLVARPGLGPLTSRPEARGRLVQARGWFLDTHRPGLALRVAREEQVTRGRPRAGAGPALAGHFLGRHAALWLALLIGAVLWLDFGDAFAAMAEVGDLRGILWTCAVGLGGAWVWVLADLRRRVAPAAPEEASGRLLGDLARATGFTGITALATLLITSGMWLLLSRTDEVLQGPEAVLYLAAWTGFALFVGVFFGLLSKGGP